jgi:hypothetical protein
MSNDDTLPPDAPDEEQGESNLHEEAKTPGTRGNPISRATYERLVEGFRIHDGNVSAAARFAGVSRVTATMAWNKGLKHPWATTPIKSLLREEKGAARTILHEQAFTAARAATAAAAIGANTEESVRLTYNAITQVGVPDAPTTPAESDLLAARTRPDAIAARAQKAQTVRTIRATNSLLSVQAAKLTRMLDEVMPRMAIAIEKCLPPLEEMQAPGYKPDIDVLTSLIQILGQVRGLHLSNARTTFEVFRLEKQLLGEDAATAGNTDMTEDEALAEVESAHQEVERLKRHKARMAATG